MQNLMPPVDTPDSLFHDGNPVTGELGTIVDAQHLNNSQGAIRDIQTELIAVLTSAGVSVDPSKHNQLLTALGKLLLGRSNPFGDIKADGTVTTAKTNLGLGPFNTDGAITTVSAPSGGVFFYIAPSGNWGVIDSAGNPLPLALANGGTGANTLLGARVRLGIASFGGDGTLTTMSSPDGKVYLYIDDAGHWGVQDSAGNPLPLAIANGGTGANTLLGARVQLGVANFGSYANRSTMSAPGASAYIFIDKNGDWGVLDSTGKVIPLPMSRGGLGATNPADARTALQLGSAATKSVGTGTGQIPDMSAFQFSAATKGYEKLPDGKIKQWGTISIPAANMSTDVSFDSFAIPFPNGVLNCRVNGAQTTTNTPCFATAEAVSTTQIRLKAIAVDLNTKTITQGMAVTVAWEAIGA